MDDYTLETYLTTDAMDVLRPLSADDSTPSPAGEPADKLVDPEIQGALGGEGSGGEVAGEPQAPQAATPSGSLLPRQASRNDRETILTNQVNQMSAHMEKMSAHLEATLGNQVEQTAVMRQMVSLSCISCRGIDNCRATPLRLLPKAIRRCSRS